MIYDIEKNLKPFLQKRVYFTLNNKIIKDGNLILFNVKDYYITFILTKKEKNKTYEIPIPFGIQIVKGSIVFDYTLKQLCKNNNNIKHILGQLLTKIKKPSKFYDSKIIIRSE